jgi:opacity protein-like surface antigen
MRRVTVIACAAWVMIGASAQAADLPSERPLPDILPAPKSPEFDSGWYLRGDIGYRINHVGSASLTTTPDPTASRINRSGAFGLGLGYKKDWFRADATIDYGMSAKFYGDTAIMAAEHTIRVETFTGLFNVYADLGTWSGITPYLGAGAGASFLRALEFHTATLVPPISGGVHGGWNFSWALIAGVSFGVGAVAVDVSYRRLNLGSVQSAVDAVGNQLVLDDIVADEIRLGMRFSL